MSSRIPPHSVRCSLMFQTWSTFSALHWRYDPALVQPLLPNELTVDTFDGAAWVSLTPFLMTGVRLPGVPPVPRASTFCETNVRTYARDAAGRDGLWFFTLEASRLAFVVAARAALGVPYSWAAMALERDDGALRYRSRRRAPGPTDAASRIAVVPGDAIPPDELGDLDVFLTGRWRGFAPTPVGLRFLPVEHEAWPLQRATLEELDETLLAACGLPPPEGEPVVHYSPGVHVRFGPPVPVGRR
jgi:uncharacterized protein YqjF (DUF2071 family)